MLQAHYGGALCVRKAVSDGESADISGDHTSYDTQGTLTVDGLDSLENYARFAGDHMILVVANNQEDASGVCTVHIPFADGFAQDYANYRVTDLLTGRVITVGRADTVDGFSAVVPYQYCGVFLVEGIPAQ